MNPLFQSSKLGSQIVIFPSHVEYKPGFLSGKITIPIKDVASVENAISFYAFLGGMRIVKIESSGGKRFKVVVRAKDRDNVVQAILKAKG